METLEKFKSYKPILFQYIFSRFGILKFTAFTILLCLLGITEIPDWQIFIENVVFIFVSLFAFRLLDDAWSFHLDRINHPERTYLLPENFQRFVVFTVLVGLIYLSTLLLFSLSLAITILILIIVSNGLYFLFFRNEKIMSIIPLLKYPVLIWCISRFSTSTEVLFLSVGAFFMMLTFDFIDGNFLGTKSIFNPILLILVTGLFIFQPWIENRNLIQSLLFVLLPIIPFVFLKNKRIALFPVLVFPLLHIIDLIIKL